jgi:hypothetical protein
MVWKNGLTKGEQNSNKIHPVLLDKRLFRDRLFWAALR